MTYRVVARGAHGEIRVKDYSTEEELTSRHTQIGTEDCSTDLRLRGMPIFRGLIGPMPDGGDVARYETPDIFENLTKQWGAIRKKFRKAVLEESVA
ncbi:MAG: hypothetical protein PHQ75_12545 [Thermoguttaceae bacterium]|nr:hypothetical protein [Thermoguttaceae bacterium]